jgi:dihydrofolate reductase
MMISVFVGTSLDGFIARKNDALDFLPVDGGEPHGYDEFIAGVDCLVIGRNTFDVVIGFPQWPYAKKRVVVLSSRPIDFAKIREGVVEQMSGEPQEIAAKLAASGVKHVYLDGGETIQRFVSAGLVDRLTVTRVPVLIGAGIPLFGSLPHDVKLRHIATHTYKSGFVKSEYEVIH